MPVKFLKGSIDAVSFHARVESAVRPLPDVHEMTGDCGRGGHDRADQMGPAALALPPFEITVRGAGASFARPQNIGIHAETHAASRLAPLEASFLEDAVETELFGFEFDLLRPRHDHRVDGRCDFAAFDDRGGSLQVADSRIGA